LVAGANNPRCRKVVR